MRGIVRQEDHNVRDRDKLSVSDFDVATRGDEFHWDDKALRIDVSDLECDPLLISDLNYDLSVAMQSTVQF